MTEKERAYLDGDMFEDLIGYCQYLDRKSDETRLYNCGGLPVELTLPEGEHEWLEYNVDWIAQYGNI